MPGAYRPRQRLCGNTYTQPYADPTDSRYVMRTATSSHVCSQGWSTEGAPRVHLYATSYTSRTHKVILAAAGLALTLFSFACSANAQKADQLYGRWEIVTVAGSSPV